LFLELSLKLSRDNHTIVLKNPIYIYIGLLFLSSLGFVRKGVCFWYYWKAFDEHGLHQGGFVIFSTMVWCCRSDWVLSKFCPWKLNKKLKNQFLREIGFTQNISCTILVALTLIILFVKMLNILTNSFILLKNKNFIRKIKNLSKYIKYYILKMKSSKLIN
jgi:hypothetical protein